MITTFFRSNLFFDFSYDFAGLFCFLSVVDVFIFLHVFRALRIDGFTYRFHFGSVAIRLRFGALLCSRFLSVLDINNED